MLSHYRKETIHGFEHDRLRGVVAGRDFEHLLVGPSECRAVVENLETDLVRLDRGRYSFDALAEGEFHDGLLCVGFSLTPTRAAVVNGLDITSDDLQVHPEGAELLYRLAAGTTWTGVHLSRERVQAEAERRLGRPLALTTRSVQNIRCGREAVHRIVRVVDSVVAEIGAGSPRASRHAELLMDAVVDVLGHEDLRVDGRVRLRKAQERTRTVREAMRWMRRRRGRPYDSVELCSALGRPERTLELYFRQVTGMGPLSWFRAARLHRARELLRASRGNVTSVALRLGFEHLGRFAEAYRELFGETPSRTLKRGA